MLVAGHGDDARRSSPPTPPSTTRRCSARWPRQWRRRSTACSSTAARSTNDTVLVLANGRAGEVDAARAHRRARRGVRFARRADGTRRRGRDQVRARACRRCPVAGRRPGCRPRRREQPARAVLAERRRSVLGSGAVGARCERRARSIPSGSTIAYNGVTVCRDGIACAARRSRARPGDGRARHRDPLRSAPRARRRDGAHHRPVARVHRREPEHLMTSLAAS